MMSQECSRSKFDGVREKLWRFRREYFCIRSSERRRLGCAARSSRPDVDEDSGQLAPLFPERDIGHCDGGQPTMTNGGTSTTVEDGCLPRRQSVPSRCASIPESSEEDLVIATPLCADCRPVGEVSPAVSTSLTGTSTNRGFSTDNDRADYDEFVRGLKSTTVTVAAAIHPKGSSEADEIPTRTVCRSTRRPFNVHGTATPCCVGRRTSDPPERRSLGGKLIRTLRKTFTLAGLGKNDEVESGGLSAETTRPTLSSFDKRSSYLRSLSTPVTDNYESMQPSHWLDKDSHKSEWQQMVVS